MVLTDAMRQHYEQTLTITRQEILDLDRQIEEELAKVKDRLADLQGAKKSARMIYDATCQRLGVPNELEAEEEDLEDDED
jgi:hypothetical protein